MATLSTCELPSYHLTLIPNACSHFVLPCLPLPWFQHSSPPNQVDLTELWPEDGAWPVATGLPAAPRSNSSSMIRTTDHGPRIGLFGRTKHREFHISLR
jgi:hypothetical protein